MWCDRRSFGTRSICIIFRKYKVWSTEQRFRFRLIEMRFPWASNIRYMIYMKKLLCQQIKHRQSLPARARTCEQTAHRYGKRVRMWRVSEWHRKCLLFLLSMNVKRINSAIWFRLCRNLIPYWILDILCGIYFFPSLDFYLWSFISSKSLETHTHRDRGKRKKNQSICKRLSMPRACRYTLFVVLHVEIQPCGRQDSHDIPGKAAARCQFASSRHLSFIPHPHSPRHFSRLLNRRNIYQRHTYLFCVAQKNVSDAVARCSIYPFNECMAWRAVSMRWANVVKYQR